MAFPELDGILGGLRQELDPTAKAGMPAHVTVLAPFAGVTTRDPGTLERLEAALGSIPAFPVVFATVGWFERRVLYLVPEPAGPFAALTRAIAEAFPAYPPYGGRFPTVVPHLTIGEDAPARALRRAAGALEAVLPLAAVASSVSLMDDGGASGWRLAHVIALRSS